MLLAKIPPTFAAALIIKSGLAAVIDFEVSSKENKLVSFLEEGITFVTLSEFDKILTKLEPTNPLDPNINILILLPFPHLNILN